MKCFELVMFLLLGVVVLLAVGVVLLGLQSRESGSDTPSNESLAARNTTNDNDDNPSLLDKDVTKESDDNSSLVDRKMMRERDENSSLVDSKITNERDENSSVVDGNISKKSRKKSSLVDRNMTNESGKNSSLDSSMTKESDENSSLVDRNMTKECDENSSLVGSNMTKESDKNSSLDSSMTKESDENSSLVDTNMTKECDENSSLVDSNMTNESGKNSSLVDSNMTKERDENTSFVDRNVKNESDEKFPLVDRKYVENVSKDNCPTSDEKKPSTKIEYEKSLRFQSIVDETLEKLSIERFKLLLSNLSSFNDPDYKSDSGVKGAEWLISQLIQTIEKNSDYAGNVTIKRFLHPWKQPTVMVSFEGTDPALKSQLVILGADLDTKYENNVTPGPGDNVGGSAVLLETTRVLLEANFLPKRSIDLHWYASGQDIEEQRGEIEIAECYTKSGVNVISMVKFDTICYFILDTWKDMVTKPNKATKKRLWEWGTLEFTDNALADFLLIVDNALWSYRASNILCETDGCYSDNASWTAYGVNAAWPMVSPCTVHPTIDTQTILKNNGYRALYLAKIATVYAIEMAEPKNVT